MIGSPSAVPPSAAGIAAAGPAPALAPAAAPQRWWWLLAALLACLAPLLIDLGARNSTHTMENIALLTAQETFLRGHGWHGIPKEDNAWLVPSRNGGPRTQKPPMLVWLNLLAWSDLNPEEATPQLLNQRARLVTVVLGLIMLGSTWWLGRTLGDERLGLIALLALGSTWFVQRQCRTASYDIHMAAFACLVIAGQIWMYRLPAEKRRPLALAAGVLLTGAALAMGWLSKGPLTLLVTAVPLLGAIVLLRQFWRSNLALLLLAVALATALACPWYLYMWQQFPESGKRMLNEYAAYRDKFQSPLYYVGILALMLPWSPWLIGGLCQPFLRATGAERRRLLVAWFWFTALLVIFSIPAAKQQRYVLPLAPAVALLVAHVFHEHDKLARLGRRDPGARLLFVPHWLTLIGASPAVGLFLGLQEELARRQWLDEPMAQQNPLLCVGVSLALLLIALWGFRQHWRWRPLSAAVATAAWALLATTFFWHAYSHSATGVDGVVADCRRMAQLVGPAPLRSLDLVEKDFSPNENEELLIYSQRIIPHVEPAELLAYQNAGAGARYLIATAAGPHDQFLAAAGWEKVTRFQSDRNYWHNLWRWPANVEQDAAQTQP